MNRKYWESYSPQNKKKLLRAVDSLGFDTYDLKDIDLDGMPPINIPLPEFKIELINYLGDRIDFDDAYSLSKMLEVEGISIRVLHVNHLIEMKEASTRPRDLLDAEELRKIRDKT